VLLDCVINDTKTQEIAASQIYYRFIFGKFAGTTDHCPSPFNTIYLQKMTEIKS
jgi:hypothetical protein